MYTNFCTSIKTMSRVNYLSLVSYLVSPSFRYNQKADRC